jgi:hypothetical protein
MQRAILVSVFLLISLAFAQTGSDIIQASGVKGGLAVHINCGDAELTQTLQVESFPGQPGREPPPAASDQELRGIAESFANTAGASRPRGLGIFVPPHEER